MTDPKTISQQLDAELNALEPAQAALLTQHGFDVQRFKQLALRSLTAKIDNRVEGTVALPEPEDLAELPKDPKVRRELAAQGQLALERGECALIVLAGGMATRMGGVIKALVPAVDDHSFLDLRLREVASIGKGCPLWLMTSAATDAGLNAALSAQAELAGNVRTFQQNLSLRLTSSGHLFRAATGQPETHAPGHGDLPEALQRSGLLKGFVETGGKLVLITNVDNLGATLDPTLIGWHLSHARPVSCEVVDKLGSDRGGIPARLDGRPVILEEFRLPESFDPSRVRVFNTNTFWIDADALLNLDMPWSYFTVTKQSGEQSFLQFERLLGEITSHLDTQFIRVPRTGSLSRFLPVKDHAELDQRREEIRQVVTSREILSA